MRVALFPRLATICAVIVTAVGCADDQESTTALPPATVTTGAPAPTPTAPATTIGGNRAPASTSTPADPAITSIPDAALAAAYDWEAPLIGGGRISLRDVGDRDVLLWFWAPY